MPQLMEPARISIPRDELEARAKAERATADSPRALALTDLIMVAMRALIDELDARGAIYHEDQELCERERLNPCMVQDLTATFSFANDTAIVRLDGMPFTGADAPMRALVNALAAATVDYAAFLKRSGDIWAPETQALVVLTDFADFHTVDITLRGGALDLMYGGESSWFVHERPDGTTVQ